MPPKGDSAADWFPIIPQQRLVVIAYHLLRCVLHEEPTSVHSDHAGLKILQ